MKKIALLILVVSSLASCKKELKEKKSASTDWLIGAWENNSNYGNLTETWVQLNDSVVTGTTYLIKEKDTLHHEKMKIKVEAEGVFYISTIKGQHKNRPVRFKLTSENPKQLVFENKNNNYPKKIIYNQITNDSMVVAISGILQGKNSTENYPMKKK